MRDEYDFSKAKKSKKNKEVKVIKTFRLDPSVLEWLETQGQKQGMGYQTYLNWFLHKSMTDHTTLEDRLKKLPIPNPLPKTPKWSRIKSSKYQRPFLFYRPPPPQDAVPKGGERRMRASVK